MARDEQLIKLKKAISSTKSAYKNAETELKKYQKEKLKKAKLAKVIKQKRQKAKPKISKK